MDLLVALAARCGASLFGALTSPRLSILIFHRVHARKDTIFPLEPDAIRFERLICFLARTFHVITLGDAITHLSHGTLPPRSLVITFDDGYADNAEIALPILQRYGLTASFFVSAGVLDGGLMWNDSIIECIRACQHAEIDLEDFGLGRYSLSGVGERLHVIEMLLPKIKYQRLFEREESIKTLHRICGVTDLPANLMMSSNQVRKMHLAGMEIGAHTVNHPILSTLTNSEAMIEIAEGRTKLESIIDAPVHIFAYPNGKPDRDFNHSHVSIVKHLGFRGAVSTAQGISSAGDDLFQLPRFTPWDDSLATWAAHLFLNQRRTKFETSRLIQ